MKNYLNEPNPLKSEPRNRSSGKGSTPRNLSKKFRQNYDQINWGNGEISLSKFTDIVTNLGFKKKKKK